MRDKFNDFVKKTKEFWTKQTPNNKNKLIAAGCGGLVLTVLFALFIKGLGNGYVVLYPGIDSTETSAVYATLKDKAVAAKINEKGEVMVPSDRKDALMLELAADFPKTAPNYGVYSTLAGFTATESDRIFYLNADLQNRLQQTLEEFTNIKRAIVTLVVPEDSNRIWESVETKSTASVTITPMPGKQISPEQVASIQNLVAGGVPKLEPIDVTVIDAVRNMELESTLEEDSSGLSSIKRADYEAMYEKRLSDKVESLLSSIYGPSGVRAVATVVFDYDKMLTEETEYIPQTDGKGIIGNSEERYSVGGNKIAAGIPGEEGNTDITNIPTYENEAETGDGGYTDIYKNIDYKISYIKKQIERGEAPLKDATISVMVKDNDFTQDRQAMLMQSISKAVNIPTDKIALTNTWLTSPNAAAPAGVFDVLTENPILIGAIMLVVLLLGGMIVFALSRGKKKKGKKGKKGDAQAVPVMVDPAAEKAKLMAELEEQKRQIRESYGVPSLDKDSIIASEVRVFTAENPEIAATLIRTWLKEEDQ